MSKTKNIGFFVALVIAILITFFITKRAGDSEKSSECTKSDTKHPKQPSPRPEDAPFKHRQLLYRLPNTIRPLDYQITIQPFLRGDQLTFNGSVSILISCERPTDVIQLHAKDELEINKNRITIQSANGTSWMVVGVERHDDDVLTIRLNATLIKNQNYTLFIQFKGGLTGSLNGFYSSTYTDTTTNEIR